MVKILFVKFTLDIFYWLVKKKEKKIIDGGLY